MEGDCAVPVELSERLKNMLDMLWQDYQCDLIRIARRAEKFKQDYLLPKIMGDGSIPDINEIKRYFQSQQSDPPQLSRIAVQHDLEYIWSQRDIGIVMDRDIANISRNIRAIEKSKSTDRLNACRKLCYLNDTARMYLYTDEIFLLLVSHYAHEYISTRIITRRHGQNTSPEIAAAIWAYWEELCRQNDNVSLRSYLEQNENPSHGLFLSPDIGLDFYFSDIADGSNKDVSKEHTKTSVFVECGKMLLDNKVMAAAVALAVGFADIYRKTGNFVFYALIIIILPTLLYFVYKLHKLETEHASPQKKHDMQRDKYMKYAACLMIAVLAWGVSFSGRVLNGDLSQSAASGLFNKIYSKVETVEKKQENTEKVVMELQDKLQKQDEQIITLAAERTHEAREFAVNIMEDNKNRESAEFERIINYCEESLTHLDKELTLQRADLLLAVSDVYVLWGLHFPDTALSKYEAARNALIEVIEIDGWLPPEQKLEAYVSLGQSYILEGDIRNKKEMLTKAIECYEKAADYVGQADSEMKANYYSGLGDLKTVQFEILTDKQSDGTGENLLQDAISNYNKALEELSMFEAPDYLYLTTTNNLLIARRKLIGLKQSPGDTGLAALCLEALKDCEDSIKQLDLEKNQRAYVSLQRQYAVLSLQLYDILYPKIEHLLKQKQYEAREIATCKSIVRKAGNAAQQALKFNASDRYIKSGEILQVEGMLKYREAILSGGDRQLFEEAIKLYNQALQSLTEADNLQQNMLAAGNKAVTLFNAGLMLKDKNLIEEAVRLSAYYLDNYSSTGCQDSLALFESVLKSCEMKR